MLKFNQKYLGYDITNEIKDNIVVVDNVKIRITKTIEKPGVYTFKKTGNKVTLEKQINAWGMPAEQAKELNKFKEEFFDRMFGDLLDKTKDISVK